MSAYKEITITPLELLNNKIIYKRVVLNNNKLVLFNGKIVDTNDEPIIGAIILVTVIDIQYCPPILVDSFYAVTNDEGEYALTLEIVTGIDYELKIFAPMIRSASKCCYNYLDKK